MDGWSTGEGPGHALRIHPLWPSMPHFLQALSGGTDPRGTNVPEAVDLLRLAQDAAPTAILNLAALRPGAGGTSLDRRTHGGGRGRDRVPGAPDPGFGGDGGGPAAQAAAGLKAGQGIVWGDEMRVGLRGQVRKVWAPRGVLVSQAVQIGWSYLYVAVALDPRTGPLWWAWQKNMKGAEMARIWGARAEEPGIGGWVWDGGHKGADRGTPGRAAVLRPRTEPDGALLPGTAPGPGGTGVSESASQAGGPWNRSRRPGPQAGATTVRLALDPRGLEGPTYRNSSHIIILDQGHRRHCFTFVENGSGPEQDERPCTLGWMHSTQERTSRHVFHGSL